MRSRRRPPVLAPRPGTAFTLNENRRVKFYERNYYDHPAFGVIALVTPAQGARSRRALKESPLNGTSPAK